MLGHDKLIASNYNVVVQLSSCPVVQLSSCPVVRPVLCIDCIWLLEEERGKNRIIEIDHGVRYLLL